MDFKVQKESLETRLSALSMGMHAGMGLSALAKVERPSGRSVNKGSSEVGAILTALDRLNAGEYGYCRICGADIAPDHLRAHPETPFCESCSA